MHIDTVAERVKGVALHQIKKRRGLPLLAVPTGEISTVRIPEYIGPVQVSVTRCAYGFAAGLRNQVRPKFNRLTPAMSPVGRIFVPTIGERALRPLQMDFILTHGSDPRTCQRDARFRRSRARDHAAV